MTGSFRTVHKCAWELSVDTYSFRPRRWWKSELCSHFCEAAVHTSPNWPCLQPRERSNTAAPPDEQAVGGCLVVSTSILAWLSPASQSRKYSRKRYWDIACGYTCGFGCFAKDSTCHLERCTQRIADTTSTFRRPLFSTHGQLTVLSALIVILRKLVKLPCTAPGLPIKCHESRIFLVLLFIVTFFQLCVIFTPSLHTSVSCLGSN